MNRLILIYLLVIVFPLQNFAQTFWFEGFGTDPGSCSSQNQVVGAYSGPNGLWTENVSLGFNAVQANKWFISATEAGVGVDTCGNGCLGNSSLTDQTLHVGNVSTSPSAAFWCPSGDCGAAYDAGGGIALCGLAPDFCTQTYKRAESPSIDCSGYSSITLQFEYLEGGDLFDNASVWYSDGSSWSELEAFPDPSNPCPGAQGLWKQYATVLPESANDNTGIQIGFLWQNNEDAAGVDPSVAIDDIELIAGAAACSYLLLPKITPVSCNGVGDGIVEILPIGGTPPFSFLWSTGDTTSIISDLTPGVYDVLVTDATGCADSILNIVVNEPFELGINADPIHPSCADSNDGSITLEIIGGTEPFSYLWSTGDTTQSLNMLGAGSYFVAVTDDKDCTESTLITLSSSDPINVTATITDASSSGSADGSISVIVAGGTPPYDLLWSTGDITSTINSLTPGVYSLQITDSDGCVLETSFSVGPMTACSITTPVTGLSASLSPSGTNAALSWDGLTDAEFYQAKGRRSGTVPFGQFVTPNTFKNVGGLLAGTTYEWKVRARCLNEDIGPFSALASFTTPSPKEFQPNLTGSEFSLIPNPANAEVILTDPSGFSKVSQVFITDLSGRVMLDYSIVGLPIQSEQLKINIAEIPAGFYLVYLIRDGRLEHQELVIER